MFFVRTVKAKERSSKKKTSFAFCRRKKVIIQVWKDRDATQHIYHDIKPEIYRPVLQLWNTLKSQFPAHKWKSIDFISQVMDDPGITSMAKIKVRTLTNDININCLMCETHI